MSKNKKIALSVISIIAALAVGIVIYILSQRAQFEDEEMKRVVTLHACRDGYIEENEALWKQDMKYVKRLNIGYMGYYTTLADIKSCINLESLYIGIPNLAKCSYYKDGSDYYNSDRSFYGKSEEMLASSAGVKIDQMEAELTEVLKECSKIKTLYVCDIEKLYQLKTLSFLEYGKNIEELWLDGQNVSDYSPVFACEKLTILSLEGCEISDSDIEGISKLKNLSYLCLDSTGISKAGDILNLSNISTLCITDTPLAENEEELASIYKTFPDIKIYK